MVSITLAYKFLTDQRLLKSLKDELKGFQEEIKQNKDKPEKVVEVQKKAMEKNLKLMTHSLKPTLYTFIPVILIFTWLRDTYVDKGAIFLSLNWIWTYVIFSIIFSFMLRKILKVH